MDSMDSEWISKSYVAKFSTLLCFLQRFYLTVFGVLRNPKGSLEGQGPLNGRKHVHSLHMYYVNKILRHVYCFLYSSHHFDREQTAIVSDKMENSFCKLFGWTVPQTLCNISWSAQLPTDGQHICGSGRFSLFLSFPKICWGRKPIQWEGTKSLKF